MQVDDMQGLPFDEQAWAVEHFLLNDPKVQQQLFKYLILPVKDLEKEGMPSNASQDQQQSWILQKAAADYTAFVASTAQLALVICPDITVDHLQPEAAGVIIEQYAKQLGHLLQQWTDSTVALANLKQVLLDVQDCPVQLAQAVYTLMGKDPPEHLLNSPVRQVSERQARTAEALEAISLTAQTVREHQLAQASQQAAANAQPPSTASAATDSQSAPPEQDSAFQLLHSAMATIASSNEAAMAPERAPVLQMIGAVMAPVVQMLKDEQQKEHVMHRASMDQLLQLNKQLSQRLDRVEQKVDSNAHFYPLMAVAMAQLSQQMHGLAQFLAAGFGSGRAKAGQLSPGAVPHVQQPVNTPQRKKMRKADDARHVARKQVLAVDERLDEQGPSGGAVQAATVLGQRQTAAAVLTGPIANGVQTVYPGKAGEELWVTWRGR